MSIDVGREEAEEMMAIAFSLGRCVTTTACRRILEAKVERPREL